MSRSIADKLKINSYMDIIGGDCAEIVNVPIVDLYEFKDHPFRVLDDEKMEETVESIRQNGVLNPGIVRPRIDGGYEIIAGHRRKRACEILGLKEMPVIIRNYSDEEAIVTMVDTNIQREDILPSEKAHAYKMKFDAMKHQGSAGGNTLNTIGQASGESGKTVQRYIRLAELSEPLLKMVDNKKIPIRSGVELSYLKGKEQEWVEDILKKCDVVLTPGKAEKIRWSSESKELTKARTQEIINQRRNKRKIVIKNESLDSYFPENMTDKEIEDVIFKLLDKWKQGKAAGR